MSKKTRLIKNTAIIAIGNVLTKFNSFLMLPLYTSLLDLREYGIVDLIATYSSLMLIIVTLQFEQGVLRYLIEARGNIKKQKEYICTSIVTVLVMNLIFCVLTGSVLFFVKYEYTFYFLTMVCTGAINALFIQIPRGLGDNTKYTIASFINGGLTVLLNVVFIAIMHFGVKGMLLATVCAYVASSFYVFFCVRIYSYISFNDINRPVFIQLLKYSLPLVPNTLCWWVVNASDRTIIQHVLGTDSNGIYAIANKFPSLFSMVSNIFQLAWTESASECAEASDRNQYYNEIIHKSKRFYSSCNLGLISLMPLLFSVMINSKYLDAYNYIPILLTAALFHSIANLYGSIYFAFKTTNKVVYTTIIAAIINILINIIFINKIGLYAAALSTLIAYVCIAIIRSIDLRKDIDNVIYYRELIVEFVIYLIVLYCYYNDSLLLQIGAFFVVCFYSLYCNFELLRALFIGVLKKLGNN